MYSFSQSLQPQLFLLSLGFGFLLGIPYDIIRAVRIAFTKSKASVIIFDILYFLTSAVLSFLFILAVNKGEIRFYILFGEAAGWLLYYFSLGIAAVKITDVTVRLLKALFHTVKTVVLFPFKIILKPVKILKTKIIGFYKKNCKKSRKNAKKLLPKIKLYVYNLKGMLNR